MPNLIQYLTIVTSAVAQKSLLIERVTYADPSTLHRYIPHALWQAQDLQRKRALNNVHRTKGQPQELVCILPNSEF